MPLDASGCASAALSAMQGQRVAENQQAVAALWAPVMRALFAAPSIPTCGPGLTAALDAAQQAAEQVLASTTLETAIQDLAGIATTFALAVAGSAIGGVAVPPPAPFVPVGDPSGAEAAAQAFSSALDLWARTGTFTVPPSPPVPWA